MKKTTFLKTMLLLCALIVGSGSAWAIDVPYKTLTFTPKDGTKTNDYASSWTETVGSDTWNIVNFNNNNWNDKWVSDDLQIIKCGKKRTGKSPDYTLQPSIATISTNAAIDKAITKVVVTLTAIDKDTYNSIKLYVASNSTFTSDDLQTISVSPIPTSAGDMTINVTVPKANCYYKLEFDTKGNKTTNGHTGLTKVVYNQNVTSVPATITTAEYATFVSPYATDFSTTGITVYTATDNEKSVTLNEVASGHVPANTPVVLYKAGADGTAINVPVIASADAVGDNDLCVSTGEDVANMYVLAMNPTIGFYPWAGTTDLSAGKIYLQGKASYGAREFLGFDDGETTGLADVRGKMADVRGDFFDLCGRKVAQPTKGLYIVNGRKVVIK